MKVRSRPSESVVHSRPLGAFAVIPLLIATRGYWLHGVSWVNWLSRGGDFALHHYLMGYETRSGFSIGPQGTPLAWHYLANTVLGFQPQTLNQFGFLVTCTTCLFLLMGIIIATSHTRHLKSSVIGLLLTTMLVSTSLYSFISAGFVTMIASASFVLAALYYFVLQDRITPYCFALGSMATAVAIEIWPPSIIPLALIAIAWVIRALPLWRDLITARLAVVIVGVSTILIADILIMTAQNQQQGGGAAPPINSWFVGMLAALCGLLTLLVLKSIQRIQILLIVGVGSIALLYELHQSDWGQLEYFARKTLWIFVSVLFCLFTWLIVKSLQKNFFIAPLTFVALLLVGMSTDSNFDFNGVRNFAAEAVSPRPVFSKIFQAIDEIETNNEPGAFFIYSGDDYLTNLWIQFGLNRPAGPVDPTLQVMANEQNMCEFVKAHPDAPIYTRRPVVIQESLRTKCGNATVDVRSLLQFK